MMNRPPPFIAELLLNWHYSMLIS